MSRSEEIPPYSTWKIFSDTIAALHKVEFHEARVQKLCAITKTKDFSATFVCPKDPSISYSDYNKLADKYKSFTAWLLGRYFHLLTSEKLSKIQEILIDAQLHILRQLEKSQPHIYREMVEEYQRSLHGVCQFARSNDGHGQSFTLEVFVMPGSAQVQEDPNLLSKMICLSPAPILITDSNRNGILLKVVRLLGRIMSQNWTSMSCWSRWCAGSDFGDFYTLLEDRSVIVDVKLEVLSSIYVEILKTIRRQGHHQHKASNDFFLGDQVNKFYLYFEQLFLHVCHEQIRLDTANATTFERLVLDFVRFSPNLHDNSAVLQLLTSGNLKIRNQFTDDFWTNLNSLAAHVGLPLRTKLDTDVTAASILDVISASPTAEIVLQSFQVEILRDVKSVQIDDQIGCVNVFDKNVSVQWSRIVDGLSQLASGMNCTKTTKDCRMEKCLRLNVALSRMLMAVKAELNAEHFQPTVRFTTSDESLCFLIVNKLNQHFAENCPKPIDILIICEFFASFPFIFEHNSLAAFELFVRLLSPKIQNQWSSNLSRQFREAINALVKSLIVLPTSELDNASTVMVFDHLNRLLTVMAVDGSWNKIDGYIRDNIQATYMKICKNGIPQDIKFHCLALGSLPDLLTIFRNADELVADILMPAFVSDDRSIVMEALQVLPDILCMTSSDFDRQISIDADNGLLKSQILCSRCGEQKHIAHGDFIAGGGAYPNHFDRIQSNLTAVSGSILKNVLKLLTTTTTTATTSISTSNVDDDVKMLVLAALPACSAHLPKFHSIAATRIWTETCCDANVLVRMKFGDVVADVIRFGQDNSSLGAKTKDEILDLIFSTLLRITKKSLQYSEFELQLTLIHALDNIITLKSPNMIAPIVKILIYMIMIPTSKYSTTVVNKFFKLARLHRISANQLYKQHRHDMCEHMVHICAVNQAVFNYSLVQSLGKISVTLEFYSAKDFVTRECQHLLPYFVAKLVKMDEVKKLIEETAPMADMELRELLASKYGHIFLHVFLRLSKDDFKKCMLYLEKTTGMSGPELRKRNFRVILNELLLNFHAERDKVLLALTLLAREDSDNPGTSSGGSGGTTNVQDYLQPQILGLLLHFDLKLMSKVTGMKDQILLSLADFFVFMGAKHVGPLRFKIIAMLRTVDSGHFPELSCEVWGAFVRSCEPESLGPQLATIFVSLLPLLATCPEKVNKIFEYLVVENESSTKDFIKDLFMIDDPKINYSVNEVIRKHVRDFEESPLKSQIVTLLKYLNHETLEVKLQSLKHLKVLMEKNREELDKMILGYNGIDPAIVELIDVLTSGCREKDPRLRLACGEVMGELGAVEPSHVPRRCAQNSRPFTLFLDEDAFVVGALNELTRALQGEKNTHNMDRFALAIQEILKIYQISPDSSSAKNHLWTQFSESQQQLMLPLISSRYIIKQPVELNLPTPIYGTAVGASFHSWTYNWTCSLISTLSPEHQNLLNACSPAMKQEHKILMYFLPHILLHSLIAADDFGSGENRARAREEFNTVLNFSEKNKRCGGGTTTDRDVLNTRIFALPDVPATIETITPEAIKQAECTKVVFIVLDFLNRWIREWQWQKGMSGRNDTNYIIIKNFLDNFCKLQLAKCNYQCAEYPRALMYLEDYIMAANNSDISSEHLSFLAKIYAELDEPDGVAGAMAVQQSEPSVEQRILAFEVSGKLSDAVLCYERMPQPLRLAHIRGLFRCYLDLDNVNTALHFVQGAMPKQRPESHDELLFEMQAEPLWRLGRYEDLDNLMKQSPELSTSSLDWGVQIGQALVAFGNNDRHTFARVLDRLKMQQVDSLGAASLEEGAYQHGYSCISKLHALNELQQVEKATHDMLLKPNDDNFVENTVKDLSKEWELRLKIVQESVRIVEPLLCLRRVALEQAKGVLRNRVPRAVKFMDSLLGECWLLSAVTARAAGVYQQAYTYTIKAEEFAPPKLFIEKAELHWLREEHEQALSTLQRGVEKMLPQDRQAEALTLDEKKLCAQAKLLIATYNDSISNVDTDVNILHYKEAVEVYKEWEKSLVRLGQFFDRIFQNYTPEERDNNKGSEMQIRMINYFGKSLLYGTSYVYQSMPRLLSIWFDYGTRLLDVTSVATRDERRGNILKMTKLIDSFLERLPTYVFLTAFSQLVSRICHPQREVQIELKSILTKLLLHYPQQSLWMIISVIKSSYSTRARICAEILGDKQLKTPSMSKLIKDFTLLAEKLIELCNKEIPTDVHSTTVSTLLRTLPRLLNKNDFSEIMIPTHKFRKLVLPNPDFSSTQHNPFPNHYVHIVGIEEEVAVLQSLQRPRKITFRGSDGQLYIQMLKPKDDLRKDFRLMEFNDVVNQLLTQEAEARQRRLNIRLYSVSPLNEECGLIEWIPNLVGLRPILMSLYKQRGLGLKNKELKEASCNIRDPLTKKREVFLKQLLPKHPPLLGEWFRRTFPDAQSWFIARTAYIRTTAVISMVGYVLGLGDRHGENILFDAMCGDTVHVDFNCLFNKGESFEWPERVPFRLTQNMVAAMGPLGVEGIFRKSCACTLKVLRTNANTLMSIVTPFVYDPLVSWPRNAPPNSSAGANNAERTNEQAMDHIKNIELRLKGIIKTRSLSMSIPLSVDGQTNHLINEAVNADNLCQMYIGWGPYL